MDLSDLPFKLDPPVLLAPMAGITDLPFRTLVASFGAGLVVSEMVASVDMINARPGTLEKAELGLGVEGTAVQLAGREAAPMAEAARMVEGQGARAAGRGVLVGGGRFVNLSRAAKVAAVTGTAYVVLRHPSLVSALGANVGRWLGWPVWLGQFLIWTLVLLPLLIVARFVYRWLLAPLLWLLVPLLKATSRTPRWLMKRQRSQGDGTLSVRPPNDTRMDPTL